MGQVAWMVILRARVEDSLACLARSVHSAAQYEKPRPPKRAGPHHRIRMRNDSHGMRAATAIRLSVAPTWRRST